MKPGQRHAEIISGKSFASLCLVVSGLSFIGCWANPSVVKIDSDPPGAQVWFGGQSLGVTPTSPVLECTQQTQYVRLELAGYPPHDIPLYKRRITYYVPWFAIVAAGVFTFSTTWHSEACWPEAIIVNMANGTVEGPKKPKSAAQGAQEKGFKKFEEADGTP